MSNAYEDLNEYLDEGEEVESIVFGEYGWGGYKEPEPNPVSHDLFGKILSLEDAKPLMQTWSFYTGFGAPECYAVNIYTNQRVIWVTQYDGATSLDSMLRHPKNGVVPNMPGG